MLAFFSSVRAQSDEPLAVIMTVDAVIMPPTLEYITRGIETAEQRDADVIIMQLNTPGGSVDSMLEIVEAMRTSTVPIVVYVSPKDAIAGSAGAIITMAGHASAMAPGTAIGAASPIESSGENIKSTLKSKVQGDLKAKARSLVEDRGPEAVELADAMIDEATAVTANEALEVGLINFVSDDTEDLLQSLNGFTVQMEDGSRTLNTENIRTEDVNVSFIEQLLLFLTDPNIVFSLFSVGLVCILIELNTPGGWVAGFIGVVCITLSTYGLGILTINWFGIIFLVIAFVLFILDIKAPTHGALTAAGVGAFIIGALVLFNSPGTPQFQRVSVPLVFGMGIFLGLLFFGVLLFALRALNNPIQMGSESLLGKTGTVKTFAGDAGQVQLESELWSAEKSSESAKNQ